MEWNKSIQIETNIETVWNILTDEAYLMQLKPQIVKSKLMETSDDGNIKIYEETYQEGKRQETYFLTLTTLENSATHKKQKFHFIIAKMIESTGFFEVTAKNENETLLTYSGANKGVSLLGKIMMLFAKFLEKGDVVADFLEKVKSIAEHH